MKLKNIQAVFCLHGSLTTRFSKYITCFILVLSFSTKSLLRLHGFLLTRSQKTAQAEDRLYIYFFLNLIKNFKKELSLSNPLLYSTQLPILSCECSTAILQSSFFTCRSGSRIVSPLNHQMSGYIQLSFSKVKLHTFSDLQICTVEY